MRSGRGAGPVGRATMAKIAGTSELIAMVRELLDYEPDDGDERMSEWEVRFVEDMERRESFSAGQGRKIAEIWGRIF